MKPILLETQDSHKLQDLGQASIQIVHDLKNQLNGLKLYATFLRRRLEAAERPQDELETIAKLISGIERVADDLSTIVRYGKPLILKRRPGVDLQAILRSVCAQINAEKNSNGSLLPSISFESESATWCGEYDPTLMVEALKFISLGAIKLSQNLKKSEPVTVLLKLGAPAAATIEWPEVSDLTHDPFRSFAGSHEIRMSLAAKIIEAHGGSAECEGGNLVVTLPLSL